MRRIINTSVNQGYLDIAILLVRIGVSVSMLSHGLMKLNKLLSGAEIKFADPIGIGQSASFYLAIFAEVICSFLLILGLFTRLAIIPLLITMLIVVVVVNKGREFGDIELPLLYIFIYLLLLATGAGKYSVDGYIESRIK
jgi:putative oxidoreductase